MRSLKDLFSHVQTSSKKKRKDCFKNVVKTLIPGESSNLSENNRELD